MQVRLEGFFSYACWGRGYNAGYFVSSGGNGLSAFSILILLVLKAASPGFTPQHVYTQSVLCVVTALYTIAMYLHQAGSKAAASG